MEEDLKKVNQEIELQSSGFYKLGKALEPVGQKMQDVGKKMESVGKDLTKRLHFHWLVLVPLQLK